MAPFPVFSLFAPPAFAPLVPKPTLLSFYIQETPCWVTCFTTTCLFCVPTSGLRFPLAPLQKGQLREELGRAGQLDNLSTQRPLLGKTLSLFPVC